MQRSDNTGCDNIVFMSSVASTMSGGGNGSFSLFPPDTPDSVGSQVYVCSAGPGIYIAGASINFHPSQLNPTATASGVLTIQIGANNVTTIISSTGPVAFTATPEPGTISLFLVASAELVLLRFGKLRKDLQR